MHRRWRAVQPIPATGRPVAGFSRQFRWRALQRFPRRRTAAAASRTYWPGSRRGIRRRGWSLTYSISRRPREQMHRLRARKNGVGRYGFENALALIGDNYRGPRSNCQTFPVLMQDRDEAEALSERARALLDIRRWRRRDLPALPALEHAGNAVPIPTDSVVPLA